jgi:tRNA modification GTPase
MADATIIALSSGSPPAAIGVIRISGPLAATCLRRLTGSLPAPRRTSLRPLRDPETGEVLDNALVLWFPGPRTATGEDLAELHVHGGRAVVSAVLGALERIDGVRLAEAGEFTRRAFANGAIDLLEAEGLADLLSAETESQRRNAIAMAGGALGRRIADWQDRLLREAAMLEALIEYDDSDDVDADPNAATDRIHVLADEMTLILSAPAAERLKDGIRVVIAGPPNAGKSTLLNAIAGRDVAITSPVPGTTRDVIEAPLAIEGVPFLFRDTAGLRAMAGDQIEEIGIGLAAAAMDTADVVLWLGDAGDAPTEGCVILVHARADLESRTSVPRQALPVSAKTGAGMHALIAAIVAAVGRFLPLPGDVALNQRQRSVLANCVRELRAACDQHDIILLAEHVRVARETLDRLTGAAGTEDMLDALFSRFCIGK